VGKGWKGWRRSKEGWSEGGGVEQVETKGERERDD